MTETAHPNRLIHKTSPYLRQHVHHGAPGFKRLYKTNMLN